MKYFRLKNLQKNVEYLENWRESGRAAWKVLKGKSKTRQERHVHTKRNIFESSLDFHRNLSKVVLEREEEETI